MDEPALVDRGQPDRQLPQQVPHDRQPEQDLVLQQAEQVVLEVVEDQHEHEVAVVPPRVDYVAQADHVRVGAVPEIGDLPLVRQPLLLSSPSCWRDSTKRA